jgi:hypothetical protein
LASARQEPERDIIPKAVDNDRVITFRVFLEPGNKMRRVTIAQPRNYSAPSTIARVADAHGVELDGHGPRPRIERRIEGCADRTLADVMITSIGPPVSGLTDDITCKIFMTAFG